MTQKTKSVLYILIPSMLTTSLLLASCSNDLHDHPKVSTGKQLFEHHCAECHNATGAGNFLLGVPANKGTVLTSNQVKHVIRGIGDNKLSMPPFPEMSEQEAAKIAAYLKSL